MDIGEIIGEVAPCVSTQQRVLYTFGATIKVDKLVGKDKRSFCVSQNSFLLSFLVARPVRILIGSIFPVVENIQLRLRQMGLSLLGVPMNMVSLGMEPRLEGNIQRK